MSNGQFSEKLISPASPTEATRFTAEIKYGLVPSVAAKGESDDLEKAILRSPALQREVNALMDKQMPRQLTCELLPSKTPLEARQFGAPLAHGKRQGTTIPFVRIAMRTLGWFAMTTGSIGVCCLFWGMMHLQELATSWLAWGFLAFYVFGTGSAVYLALFMVFKPPQSCWFCPRGIIWMTGAKIEWRKWDEVHEIYFRLHAWRPAIGLRIGDEIGWFTLSNSESISERAGAVEAVASAAKMPAFLNHVAAGNKIRFGSWEIDRFSLRTPESEIHWKRNAEIEVSDFEITIRDHNGRQITFSIEQMAFPGLFVTLTRALIVFWRESSANWQRA